MSKVPTVRAYVLGQLTQNSDPSGVYDSRIRDRHLPLENPARPSKFKTDREAKRADRRRRPFGGTPRTKDPRMRDVWKFNSSEANFDLFLPLHHLWLGYMSELLGLSPPPLSSATPTMPAASTMHARLVKADFHGSIMTVRKSKNVDLVGLSGIVVLETANTFKIVTKKNEIKLIPKQNSIFAFAVPLYSTLRTEQDTEEQALPEEHTTTVLERSHIEFELYGNQFRFRAADRAGKKFKNKETIEL